MILLTATDAATPSEVTGISDRISDLSSGVESIIITSLMSLIATDKDHWAEQTDFKKQNWPIRAGTIELGQQSSFDLGHNTYYLIVSEHGAGIEVVT